MPDILSIKALIFVLAALSVGAVFRPQYDDDRVSTRIIAYWILGAVVGFLVEMRGIKMCLLGALLVALTPRRFEDRPAFFICTFLALPQYAMWFVPFPGINYLFRLDHGILMTLAVAVPMLFGSPNTGRNWVDPIPKKPALVGLFCVAIVWVAVLSARDTTFTNMLRIMFGVFCTYLIPYLALVKWLRSHQAFHQLLAGLTTVACLVTFLALLTIFQNWNHYELTGDSSNFANTAVRNGERRVNLTAGHTIAGIFLTAATICFWHAARNATKFTVTAYPLLFLSFMGVLGTQSRGALLCLMATVATIIWVRIKFWPIRIGLALSGAIGLFVLYSVLSASGFDAVDAHGTFDYRARLLEMGLEYIWVHPIAGSSDFAADPFFEPLRQGQGIIDFVNGYLLYTLRWGLVGLGMFLTIWAWSGVSGINGTDRLRPLGKEYSSLRGLGIGYVGIFGGTLVAFFGASDSTYFPLILTILAAIGQSYGRVTKYIASSAAEDPKTDARARQPQSRAAPPEKPPTPTPAKPKSRPRETSSVWA